MRIKMPITNGWMIRTEIENNAARAETNESNILALTSSIEATDIHVEGLEQITSLTHDSFYAELMLRQGHIAYDTHNLKTEVVGLGNGYTTVFTISEVPSDIVSVSVGGEYVSNWTWDGFDEIEFNTAPAMNAQILIEYTTPSAKLVLGEETDPNRLEITNEGLDIYNDNQRVAYLKAIMFYMQNAQVVNRLKFGDFALIPRANGNMSLKWLGGA